MKQTAVEWLIDESMKLVVQYMKGTLNEDTLDDVIYELGTKAKEMEKEKDARIKELETFLEEEIIEDVYHYMSPLWHGATKLLKNKSEK
jgi:arsenate reductase-like glutaredoxin family protein